MNLKNKNKNDNMKSVNQLNKRKFTKGKIEENNKQTLINDIYEINLRKNLLNKNKNRNHYYRKLLSQNLETASIIKKFNDFKNNGLNNDYLTTEYLEIKDKLNEEKDKLNDYEKLISNTDFLTVDNKNYDFYSKLNLKEEIENRKNKTIDISNSNNYELVELRNENKILKENINELRIQIEKIKNEYLKIK